MTTTMRGAQLAAEFAAGNAALIAAVTGCTEEQWRRVYASEGWPVAVVAHHLAIVQRGYVGLVTTLAAGETYSPRSSLDEVHRLNAQHAEEHATVGKPETLDLLRTSGDTITSLLQGLDDEQLDRIAGRFGDQELRVAQVVEQIVIGHAGVHRASIEGALAN